MKKIILFLFCITLFMPLLAQELLGNKGLIPIKGGDDGKTYAVIIRTDLGKQALVDTTTTFLARYDIVDKSKVNLNEIDESTSEYTIPVIVRQTIYIASGMMGVKMPLPPVMLEAELRFEFHDNGGVMIVAQNFKNHLFQFTANREKLESPAHAEYRGEESAQLMSNSVIGKVLIALNTGIDGYAAFMKQADDYFADISSKYEVYDILVNKEQVADWLTDEKLIEFTETTNISVYRRYTEVYKKAYSENQMLGIGQKRWEDQFRSCFDLLFKSINAGVSGKIEGVAEDGEQTWTLINGLVVPTDPKLQKKYLKNKEQY